MSSCTPTVTRGLLIALSIITPCLRTVEFMWLLQHSPSRENYLFVCSCIKCVSQTDELDVTSEEEEEDEGEAEGETEGDEAEDEMTDVWWKTFPLRLFPFPTPHCKQQPKPRRINNRARCGKTLSVCFTGRWFWFSDRRTSEEVKGCGFCTRQQINGRTTWSVFPWWWNHVFKLLFFFKALHIYRLLLHVSPAELKLLTPPLHISGPIYVKCNPGTKCSCTLFSSVSDIVL